MSWQDREYRRSDEQLVLPFVQWVNDGNTMEPRAQRGGFACPASQGVDFPGETTVIHHRSGDTTEVVFTGELEASVVKTRFAWVKGDLRLQEYVDGARGKLQAVCYVKGLEGQAVGPVMLTFTGLATRRFNEARQQFMLGVQRTTNGKAPSYAFWMGLRAGEVEVVGAGQQSPITPIELAREVDPDCDYVGDELLDAIPWERIEEWAAAWDKPGPNGEGVLAGEVQEGTQEWAELQTVSIRRAAAYGALLSSLDDAALEWIVAEADAYPTDAKAARILLRARQEAPAGEEEPPF